MSGRSAYVRAKNNESSDKRPSRHLSQYAPDDPYVYGYGDLPQPLSRPGMPAAGSYMSPPRVRRRSQSSLGSAHSYPSAPHLHKPRPIVIASAIEKSDFRTHLDGMSSTLRGKLGGLMKTGKKETDKDRPRRPGTSSYDSEYDYGSRSTQLTTPSIGAVPSLSHSDTTSDTAATFPSALTSFPVRHRAPQESVTHKIRKFEGGGKLPQLGWKSLSNTPELWDESGDTYVYMYMHGSLTKPPPSFRIDSRVIRQSRSKTFIDQLDNPSEPEGWPKFYPSNPTSRCGSPSLVSNPHGGLRSSTELLFEDSDSDAILPIRGIQFAPKPAQSGIQHELYVVWPGPGSGIQSTIWHITTRNYFAVMCDASALVGTTLYDAMTKLIERLTKYPDYLGKGIDKVDWVTRYLVRHHFDDVRNNPSYAASLLAFSEMDGVRWRAGYIEAFVHCVGMLDLGLQTISEYRHVTQHTKMFLENASMQIEERIGLAQRWLQSFDFNEMWPTTMASPSVPRACYDRFRKWLCKYYENAYLHWPPSNDLTWLSRDVLGRLHADFCALYDYLVDRDVIFDESSESQKWTLSSRSGRNFRADTFELPFTDILVGFDDRKNIPHIPHPYPMTPPSVSTVATKKSAFTLKKSNNTADILLQTRRKALSYAEATNLYTLRNQQTHTDLVTNYIRFEQQDEIESLDPFEARRGRWILIYGILQILATITVDSPNLRYKEDAQYYLCPQMKGVVPWAEPGSRPEEEANHKLSHCWIAPSTWGSLVPNTRPNSRQPDANTQLDEANARNESVHSGPMAKLQPDVGNGKTRDASIGRKRAEEWLNANSEIGEFGSDNGMTIETTESLVRSDGVVIKSEAESVDSGIGQESYDTRLEAKRRRKEGHSDYQAPKEW